MEDKTKKLTALTFSPSFELLNKQELSSAEIDFSNFSIVQSGEGVHIFAEGGTNEAFNYVMDFDGNLSEKGKISGITNLSDRLQYYKSGQGIFLLRTAVDAKGAYQQTTIQLSPEFKKLKDYELPKEMLYEGYFKKSPDELNPKFELMHTPFQLTESFAGKDGSTYLFDYRSEASVSDGIYAFIQSDIFITKFDANQEIVFRKLVKRGLKHQYEFPQYSFSDDQIIFEDTESPKLFENGQYQNDYKMTITRLQKMAKILVTVHTDTGKIERKLLE